MDAIALLESLAITSVPSPRSHDHPGATAHLSGAKERRSIGTVAASANRVMYLTSNYRGMDLWTGGELRSTLSKRHGVLASVAESPKTKPELVAALDQSRSTIDRAVTELSTVDCIEPRHDDRSQYRCTQTGRLALETYREYCADATLLAQATPVVNALPPDVELSQTFVADAALYSSTKTPDVALQPAIERLPDATKLTGTAPVVFSDYFDVLSQWVQEGDAEIELVLEADLLESIVANHTDEFSDFTDCSSIDLYVHEREIPYALWILDQESSACAGTTIYENGSVKGSLVADSIPAVRWARGQYEQYRDASTALSLFE